MLALVFLIAGCPTAVEAYLPVILVHGHNGTPGQMDGMKDWIEKVHPGQTVYVVANLRDITNANIWVLSRALDGHIRELVEQDPSLQSGFHLVGESLGTMVTRAWIQDYNDPPVQSYISLGGIHGGFFADFCLYYVRVKGCIFHNIAYNKFMQNFNSLIGLWRDPYHLKQYEDGNLFLPIINNEVAHDKYDQYRTAIKSLSQMVLIIGSVDQTIAPRQAGLFAAYSKNEFNLLALEDRDLYKEDWLGLRELDEKGRLHKFVAQGLKHTELKDPDNGHMERMVLPYIY